MQSVREETLVPLHATDFAGLGFTVAGTLRDGIYVKDLLNKGPAALSGRVKPGKRPSDISIWRNKGPAALSVGVKPGKRHSDIIYGEKNQC